MPREQEIIVAGTTAVPPPKKLSDSIANVIAEVLAILFWTYAVIKIFIFDIDNYLINRFLPQYADLLKFKFLFLIGIIATALILTKNRYLIIGFFYILFYPLVLILWKIPYFIFKQKSWLLAFAFINSTISFFQSFKLNFVASSVFLIAMVLTLNFSNALLLWISILAILSVLSVLYVRKFIVVFQPSVVFQTYLIFFVDLLALKATIYSLDLSFKDILT